MRVLVTGATGFIGTNLSLQYTKLGHQVIGISKEATEAEKENATDLKQAGVELLKGSITDEGILRQALQGVDLVFHIAAAMREANIPDKVFWDVNVDATRRLLEMSRQEGASRFVYCSSIGAMGWSMQKPSNENSLCKPEDIYQVTKKAAEELCLEFQRKNQYPVVILRPADVYGPRDRRLLKLFKGVKKGRFVMIGSGENEHHMVHVEDLVAAFMLAAEVENATGEIFIIAEECPVQVNRLVEIIAEETGSSFPKIKLPMFPVQAAAVIVEGVCKPLGIQPPLYPRRVDFFRTDYSFDISKAKQVLGYQPKYDLKSGIRNTLQWYEERGLL
jgi:dihydroflavonol-4-reductase